MYCKEVSYKNGISFTEAGFKWNFPSICLDLWSSDLLSDVRLPPVVFPHDLSIETGLNENSKIWRIYNAEIQ